MINNNIYPWQKDVWERLQKVRETLPHAILFHGAKGIGKVDFAEFFAKSLLCENPDSDGAACGECISCNWFDKYSHMDFRRIRPEIYEENEGAGRETKSKDEEKATKKSASKIVKIEQVREISDFLNISTHRNGYRVVLLYPAESLNTESSNALLKTLEEPQPRTVFLLVADKIGRLLPTIISRCRKFTFPMPSREDAFEWLKKEGVDDAESWLAGSGGAPLLARQEALSGENEDLSAFLDFLANPNIEGVLNTAENMEKIPMSALLFWLQRWLYDLLLLKSVGKVRYYPRYEKLLIQLASRVDLNGLLKNLRLIGERNKIAEHPLVPRLFIEDTLFEYMNHCFKTGN